MFKSKFGWRRACLLYVSTQTIKHIIEIYTLSHSFDLKKLPQMVTSHEFLRTNWTAKILFTLTNGKQMESLLITAELIFHKICMFSSVYNRKSGAILLLFMCIVRMVGGVTSYASIINYR